MARTDWINNAQIIGWWTWTRQTRLPYTIDKIYHTLLLSLYVPIIIIICNQNPLHLSHFSQSVIKQMFCIERKLKS